MKLPSVLMLVGCACAWGESFETVPAGPFTTLQTAVGRWSAAADQASVLAGRGHRGNQSLRLGATGAATVLLELPAATAPGCALACFAERWTKRPPFAFTIEAMTGSTWQEIHRAAATAVKVGGFLTELRAKLPAGTRHLRFTCSSASPGGILLDDVLVTAPGPLHATLLETNQPVCPAMVRASFNPVLGFRLTVSGSEGSLQLEGVEFGLDGSTRRGDIERVQIFAGSAEAHDQGRELVAETTRLDGRIALPCKRQLAPGDNWFWISVVVKAGAALDGRLDAALFGVTAGGKVLVPAQASPPGSQRLGYAVRLPGDDQSQAYRIPGLVRTKAGSLLAVYDIRHRHAGDLPADIDVGVSRSTDGGQTWAPMRVAMDMGRDPQHGYDGVGDPCVLVDENNGRIWIAGSWSHGQLGWNGSKPGLESEQTNQLMMTWSDDDGRSWAPARNLTKELKDPAWRLFLQGPGSGITLRDGTLVMPAQYRAANGEPDQGKPFATLIWSKDHGQTWQVGSGVKSDTTEAQLAQLADGSILINCRDNRGGSRTVAVTHDLGRTWRPHPTDRQALREPVCMASLLRWQHPRHGDLMFFSNPDSTRKRHRMTVKLSRDQALSWPSANDRLYDSRPGYGYSCLAIADSAHLGVLYEGAGSILFLRLPLTEWFD